VAQESSSGSEVHLVSTDVRELLRASTRSIAQGKQGVRHFADAAALPADRVPRRSPGDETRVAIRPSSKVRSAYLPARMRHKLTGTRSADALWRWRG
jgi:hypothetical protein